MYIDTPSRDTMIVDMIVDIHEAYDEGVFTCVIYVTL